MRISLILIFCCACLFSGAQQRLDSLFTRLDNVIDKRQIYLDKKLSRLANFKEAASRLKPAERYDLYIQIYNEYKSFIYDSAFRYATQLQKIASSLHDRQKIDDSKINLGFVLVSSGLFNEALDTLRTIRPRLLNDSIRANFFYLMARTCYDLADFNRDDYYSKRYSSRGHLYIDSALSLVSPASSRFLMMTGIKRVRQQDMAGAQSAFEKLIGQHRLSPQDYAVAASTLSFIYRYSQQVEKSKEMLIRAAITDIESSTKETLATLNLADLLFEQKDVDNAYKFIKIAMEDANYYGARHRKIQVAAVFPIIEGQKLNFVESRRRILFAYSALITLLVLLTVAFAYIIFKQFRRLQETKKALSKSNDVLTDTNHQLGDANKIKEEYIWYYFNVTADHINKLDALKKSMETRLITKRIDDLKFTVDSINIKKERENLYDNFDRVFLKLFPDFVRIFNASFKPEDQLVLKEGQLLNTELRIFALFRMGIHDNEKIAKILDYSVTTIYTYKTRIRNKSLLPNEEFDKHIMSIRAI